MTSGATEIIKAFEPTTVRLRKWCAMYLTQQIRRDDRQTRQTWGKGGRNEAVDKEVTHAIAGCALILEVSIDAGRQPLPKRNHYPSGRTCVGASGTGRLSSI